jgi:hypothetical protein
MAPKRKAAAALSTQENQMMKKDLEVAKVEAPKPDLKHVARALSPRYPSEKKKKEPLRENLAVMGCKKLMDLPWGYTMIQC